MVANTDNKTWTKWMDWLEDVRNIHITQTALTGVPEQAAVPITGSRTSGIPVRRVEQEMPTSLSHGIVPTGTDLKVYKTKEKYMTLDPDQTSVENNDQWRMEMSHNDSEGTLHEQNHSDVTTEWPPTSSLTAWKEGNVANKHHNGGYNGTRCGAES